jgi:cellulose synthase/poly-beta-1,6-N-acetylglucosamine synthase-like glycosyltransferase
MLYNFLGNKKKMEKEEKELEDHFPSVTFLVPGWNEANTIGITVDSIFALDYPKEKLQVIFIDNNSTDNTKQIAQNYVEKYKNFTYLFESKQGKHNAMNQGLEHVTGELVACLDADSTLAPNAMTVAAQYFKDPNIMALASCMQLRDIKTLWQRSQAVEYMLSIFWRKAYSAIDAIQVMPGPFSVFRKRVFDELGNYKSAHNAEDFEMTLRLHKNHYKIANAHKAYVYTVGPATLRGLIRQRVRWIRGFLENAWDYRDMFFKSKYGHFGLFTLPMAAVFIFYVLYAVGYTVLKFIDVWYIKISDFLAVGPHIPKVDFDIFYISTDVFFFQSMFLLTVLAFVLLTSRQISQDKNPIMPNFAIYFLLYPFVAPIFIFVAVFKFLFNTKNTWALQDTKIKSL